ncbi:MAG: MFS transporter [Opitutales bacterium]
MIPRVSQTRQNLRTCSLDGILATPWSIVSLPGSFLVASLLNVYFQVGPFWFGVIVSMPALANALSILLVPWVGRFLTVREMTLTVSMMNCGIWLSGLLAIALVPLNSPARTGFFFAGFYLLLAFTTALAGVGWTAWVPGFIPERIRGRYMAGRNVLTNFSTLGFMFLALLLLHFFEGQLWLYLFLISLALLGRISSVFMQHRIRSKDPTGGRVCSDTWAGDLWSIRRERLLMRYILFATLAGCSMAFTGATATLYAFGLLRVTPADLTAFSIVATLAGTASVRIWGELIDRHGSLPVLVICAIAWRLGDIGWLFLTEETKYGLFAVWAWGGAMGTGYMLASFILLLKLVPPHNRGAGISLHLTAVSTFAAIAPIVAGWWLETSGGLDIPPLLLYRATLAAGLSGCVLSLLALTGLNEPKTHPDRNTIMGALRTLRQLSVNQGLAFWGNATFVVRRRRKR